MDSTSYGGTSVGCRMGYPQWVPAGRDIESVPAGVYWNAVRVPRSIGEQVLTHLGEYTGAVIEDVPAHKLYWLVPPKAAKEWDFPEVGILSNDAWVGIPGPFAEHLCHWRVTIDQAGPLTEPDALRSALVTVLGTGQGRS